MSRVQLALRVSDLGGSIAFYRSLFGVEPAKRRPGYANFAITEPPLKLVRIEGAPDQPAAECEHALKPGCLATQIPQRDGKVVLHAPVLGQRIDDVHEVDEPGHVRGPHH
ncbi:MAG: VOC family protein [Pseudonocardiaceae bacterium]